MRARPTPYPLNHIPSPKGTYLQKTVAPSADSFIDLLPFEPQPDIAVWSAKQKQNPQKTVLLNA